MAASTTDSREHSPKKSHWWSPSKWSSTPVSPPQWLPLPKIAFGALCFNLLFITIALIISGLVLGGTFQVTAKAIGLTQSLVLFSSVFGIAYTASHIFAARKSTHDAERFLLNRSPLHTKIVIVGRITIALWCIALLAVAISLGRLPVSSASSQGPLKADLAACIVNCLDMIAIAVIVERTRQPFDLPWITPPIPKGQSSSAKALIDDIIGDGISGTSCPRPADTTEEKAMEKPTYKFTSGSFSGEYECHQGTTPPRAERTDSERSMPLSEEPFPSSCATLVERQELWNRVSEGARDYTLATAPPQSIQPPAIAAPPFSLIPPVPLPVPSLMSPPERTASPPNRQGLQQQHKEPLFQPYESPLQAVPRPTLSRTMAGSPPRYMVAGPRPLREAERDTPRSHLNHQNWNELDTTQDGYRESGIRLDIQASVSRRGGRTLFNKAVEGLKASGSKEGLILDDWSAYRVPGSFFEV